MRTKRKNLIPYLLIATILFMVVSACSNKNSEPKNWAEKLGFPAGKKVIILHADDAGMSEEANIAVQKQLKNGDIQSAAVMMPCPNAEEMIEWAKENPKHDIGIHLTLTSEWKDYRWGTVADSAEVPGLLDPDGKMWRSVREVVMNATPAEVEKEIKAQIDKAIAMGVNCAAIATASTAILS